MNFTFQTTGKIICKNGAVNDLVPEIKKHSLQRVQFVVDPFWKDSELLNSLEEMLNRAGISSYVFSNIEPDPSYQTVEELVSEIKTESIEMVIGVGGGSALDCAKTAALLSPQEIDITACFGVDLVPRKGLPVIAVPTTAGTGSEVTPIAIFSDNEAQLKKGIVSPYLYPDTALLDPELTHSLPPEHTAATGMDALIHAMEAYTSKKANPQSDLLAKEAVHIISSSIVAAYTDGNNIKAREQMLYGSMLAGMAFANSSVTAVHAFAYPIGATFHIPHGVANAIMLPPVFRFNMQGNETRFAELASYMGYEKKADNLITAIEHLVKSMNVPTSLKAFGVTEGDATRLAESVMKVTRLLSVNPKEITHKDAEHIYRSVL